MKRFFDVAGASAGLVIAAPLIVWTALLVKKELGSPILFEQKRTGIYGEPFRIYKFRSMTNERSETGELLSDDERMTSTGEFIRKYSLDELPQLINVLKGDLSLVGPRPLLLEYMELYNENQMKRHTVRPGITGWSQVNGRNGLSWQEKFEMDVWYVENKSFLLDIKILCMTLQTVFKKEGVTGKDGRIMEYFTGN